MPIRTAITWRTVRPAVSSHVCSISMAISTAAKRTSSTAKSDHAPLFQKGYTSFTRHRNTTPSQYNMNQLRPSRSHVVNGPAVRLADPEAVSRGLVNTESSPPEFIIFFVDSIKNLFTAFLLMVVIYFFLQITHSIKPVPGM